MENPVKSFFGDLKKLVVEYVEARLQLTKLQAYEKLAKLFAVFLSGIIITIIFVVVLITVTMMCGSMLNAAFDSYFIGYAIICGIYLVGFLILLIYRKQLIERRFMNVMIKILFEEDGNDEGKNH